MTIEDARPPAPTASNRDSPVDRAGAPFRRNVIILLLLAAGYALTILVFQPGYPTLDARYVYTDAKTWTFADWQSPVMTLLWWLIDPLAPGAWSMFLLIASLYWLGFGILALTIARQGALARHGNAIPRVCSAGILLRRNHLA